MERILRIARNPGDTILDFFAGPDTLAQAVAKLNAEDGGDRRFILVSSTEANGDHPDKNLCPTWVSLEQRDTAGGVALVDGKGSQWWSHAHEAGKADASHIDCGAVFMVGRERGQRDFVHLRQLGSRLHTDGAFSLDRLRW